MLWLIIKPGGIPTAEEEASLRKIVMYLHIVTDPPGRDHVWLRDNHQQILEKNEIRSAYFDVSQFSTQRQRVVRRRQLWECFCAQRGPYDTFERETAADLRTGEYPFETPVVEYRRTLDRHYHPTLV